MSSAEGSDVLMAEPIRVLCVFSLLDRGGAENMCMNIYRHLDRDKVQFDFVKHFEKKGDFEDEIISLGGRIYQAPRFVMYNYLSYIQWWKKHFEAHPEHQIVHGHFFTISPIYLGVAKKYGRITINHIHGTTAGGGIRDFIAKRSDNVSDYRFACSDSAGKWGYSRDGYKIIKNALDVERYRYNENDRKAVRDELGLSKSFVLGTVANHLQIKNPFGLIKIFEAVSQKNSAAKLLWIGAGPMYEEIKEEIKNRKLEDKIILMGNRNDVPRLLQAMDVFLLPSLSEGLPVSLIEAQTSGLPCLCSDVITREVDVTGLCKFISIEEIEKWADECIGAYNTARETAFTFIDQNGYNICETSKWLQDFYTGLVK